MADLATSTDVVQDDQVIDNTTGTTSTQTILTTPTGDWRASLPEDIRNDPSLADVQDVNSLASQFINSQKMIGGRIPMPGQDDEAGWNELYNKLGRPEAADKYQVAEEAYHGLERDADFEAAFFDKAYQAGLSNKQVTEILDWYNGQVAGIMETVQINPQDAMNTLRQEWGNATQQKIGFAQRAIGEFGGEEFVNFLAEQGLDSHPAMVRFAAAIGEKLMEDSSPMGTQTQMILTPEEAKLKIGEIMNNPDSLYHATHVGKPGHHEAIAEMQRLYALAYPEQPGS